MRPKNSKSVVKLWRNTHFYDKNISKETLEKIKPFVDLSNNISKDEKLLSFNELKTYLEKINISTIGMFFYDQMIKSYINKDSLSYDPINNLDSINLLYIIYLIYHESNNNNDILLLLGDQLEDMKTGFCPQGRTIRLLQIINLFL